MTNTTVVHDADSLLNLARLGDDAAWAELVERCAVPVCTESQLEDVARTFPVQRSLGQHRYSSPGIGIAEGRTITLTIGPGLASLRVTEAVRTERAAERVAQAVRRGVDLLSPVIAERAIDAGWSVQEDAPGWNESSRTYLPGEDVDGERVRTRFVTEWSRKSRTRMLKAFVSVDWSALDVPGAPLGMVTLTYPGDWLAVAPSGRVVKRHLKAFRQRYGRALGRRLDGAWKLEFQGRGAPHFHLLMPVPALVDGERFESWLSRTWASIVGADDSVCVRCGTIAACTDDAGNRSCSTELTRHRNAGTGVDFGPTSRSKDVKYLGVYFMKHGAKTADDKEYQHWVPKAWLVDDNGELTPDNGPGRFWGMWGLKPATVAVELDVNDFVTARRVLRKVAAARARSIAYNRARREGASAKALLASQRRARSQVLRGSRMVGGFVVVNDGARLAGDLARAINLARLS